ncbi:uncharacterized protein mlip isoform X1 [Halichoeres trimaculatus]|uniref:uncharacterized protein mlip isoform X1 n=1 Tax=Halichoeres trimaculatus TaxID=147232 RepID=UPI003D9F5F28
MLLFISSWLSFLGSTGDKPKPSVFTFVPVVWELPTPKISLEGPKPGAQLDHPNKSFTVSQEKIMSDREVFKAEKVFIRGSEEGGAGRTKQAGTKPQLNVSPDPLNRQSPVYAQAENKSHRQPAGTASMETAVYKHRGLSQQQCYDTSGLSETHKIKQSYKSLAAIPTNTLLLDQQVIDEQVERGESPYDTLDGGLSDTHAEMCSPSQLRQQSAELYAVIDEILANSIPPSKTSRSPQPSRSSTNAGPQSSSTRLKSLGRETKYASLSTLHPSTGVSRKFMETKKTKPGVIRPMTAIPRLTVEDEEEFHPNPFRQHEFKQPSADNRKVEHKSLSQPNIDFYTRGKRSPFSACHLQISEPEDQINHQMKEAATSFSTTEGRMNPYETHI